MDLVEIAIYITIICLMIIIYMISNCSSTIKSKYILAKYNN